MNLRMTLYELAARYRLPPLALERLLQLAGLHDEPPALRRRLPRAIAVLAAAFGGFGLVMWIAANWAGLGRFGRFAVLEAALLALCAGAAWLPRLRTPCALLAMLTIGALFALFGQTYQTGADAWRLFAWWALLGLPLCLAVRSDVLWAPWALVAMCAISLWVFAHAGHGWQVRADTLCVHALGWALAILLALLLGPLAARHTGAGPWASRGAVALAVMLPTLSGVAALFPGLIAPHYPLALVWLLAGAAALAHRAAFDVFSLSAVALGVNVLLVGGLARLLFSGREGELLGALFLLGLTAALLLAASVGAILRLARRADDAAAGGAP